MSAKPPPPAEEPHHFLTVEDAAKRLGLSRLRVREAVARGELAGRQDNRGRLRVDLPKTGAAPGRSAARDRADAPALVECLFDEIDELYDLLAARDAEIGGLSGVAARQQAALDRALGLIETQEAALAAARAETARLAALLDRALASAEALAARPDARARDAQRVEPVLERAMQATARMEAQIAARDAQLAERDRALDRVLGLAERSLAVATDDTAAAERVSLWRRLFGRTRRTPGSE